MTVVNIYNRQRKYPITKELKELIVKCCEASLECEGFCDDASVDVSLVGSRKIREYNRDFRGVDRVTDVLSFPLGQNGVYEKDLDSGCLLLGDIVICLERAEEQSKEYGHSFEREVGFLTVHSMLHLLGYDHMEEPEGDIMRAHEKKILNKIGLTRN